MAKKPGSSNEFLSAATLLNKRREREAKNAAKKPILKLTNEQENFLTDVEAVIAAYKTFNPGKTEPRRVPQLEKKVLEIETAIRDGQQKEFDEAFSALQKLVEEYKKGESYSILHLPHQGGLDTLLKNQFEDKQRVPGSFLTSATNLRKHTAREAKNAERNLLRISDEQEIFLSDVTSVIALYKELNPDKATKTAKKAPQLEIKLMQIETAIRDGDKTKFDTTFKELQTLVEKYKKSEGYSIFHMAHHGGLDTLLRNKFIAQQNPGSVSVEMHTLERRGSKSK